jgi:glycosyltransferase involved in cell wall biosynthesis
MPAELRRRGFQVVSSALLARLGGEAEPSTPWDRRLFCASRAWLAWALRRPRRFNWLRSITGLAPRCLHRRGVSIFLDPLYTLFYGSPDAGVVLVYDITTVSMDGWHHPHVSWLYGRAFEWLARSRCHLVATCENTADHLRANWGIPPHRLTVLPLGLSASSHAPRPQASIDESPFLLFVGSVEPRKNIQGLIHAYAASGLYESRGIRLRIIGSLPGNDDPVLALARSTPGVDVLGFVDDSALNAAYERCLAFVYPSFCEGFGLPLLEAMHRGCVCVSTNLGASPEIAENAAFYVDPYSTEEIAAALCYVAELADDERERIATRARERSRVFTWERFYDGLATVIRSQSA